MSARPNSTDSVLGNLRRSIAIQAARLIAEEGIDDFAFAKRKAARQLGVPERDLPTNAEVEEELASWRRLYRDEDDDERLTQMRAAALDVMRQFAQFRPYVTGAVVDGLGDAFSELELEVFADSAKDVEIFLLGLGLAYEHRETRRSGHDAPEALLVFDWGEVPVKLAIYSHLAERTPHRPHAGMVQERMRLEAFEALLGKVADTSE
jgi:hypothetical protein